MTNGAVAEVLDRKARPAHVRFERVPVQDLAASAREGRYVAKDIDYANVTPPYSKDIFKSKVSIWLKQLDAEVAAQRLPAEWRDRYVAQYKAWLNGQELPMHGTPIKGWGVLSPAQQETLIHAQVLTVEDLAGITDEGIRRVGMGAVDLKNKAKAWLAQMNDKGPLTMEMARLQSENDLLKANQSTMQEQINQLAAMVKNASIQNPNAQVFAPVAPAEPVIAVTDILDVQPPAEAALAEAAPQTI